MAIEYYETVASIIAAGQFTQVVQHFAIDDPVNTNSFEVAEALAGAMDTVSAGDSYSDLLVEILSVDSFISSFRARRISPASGAEAIKVFTPASLVGVYPGNVESAGVAGCAIWIPADDDGATGRTFYPGVSEEAVDDGYWANAYITAMNALLSQLINLAFQTTEGDFRLVLKQGPTPGFTFSEIVNGYLSPSPGTIRRRRTPI